jgi:catechol 2,3-dioxygenase-like lactoylglutathione lyase family enzyme
VEILASRILLQARDLDATLAFYEGALGLHRFREFGTRPHRGVVFFLGGGYLEVTETDPGVQPEPPAGIRVWLQVRDLRAAAAALGDAGVVIVDPPERKPWGLIEATVHDPDGLPLVLVEIPEDHPMRRDTR